MTTPTVYQKKTYLDMFQALQFIELDRRLNVIIITNKVLVLVLIVDSEQGVRF